MYEKLARLATALWNEGADLYEKENDAEKKEFLSEALNRVADFERAAWWWTLNEKETDANLLNALDYVAASDR